MIDVLYIFSVNYSGSHLLASMLGAHSRCASIGELRNFNKFQGTEHADAILSDYSDNPIFAGLAERPQDEWYREIHGRIVKTHPSVTVLVDNSKKIKWAMRYLQDPDIRSTYVHLIRDPRALLRRWRLNYKEPRQMRGQRWKLLTRSPRYPGVALFGDTDAVLLYKWLRANQQITDFMNNSGNPHCVLTYHDMAKNAAGELSVLMRTLGLEYEEQQLRFADGRNYGTHKTDYVDLRARSEIKMDLRWKQDLSAETQGKVLENPDIRGYLRRIGVGFVEEGLTKN